MSNILESKRLNRRDHIKTSEFEERIVKVSRVTKVVKGGKIFSFSVLAIVGNKDGSFGIGLGKALEVDAAKKKAINDAKNHMYAICMTTLKTIPHYVEASFNATKVIMRPAKPGIGIIAGAVMRTVFECIGIKDIVAKNIGSSTPHNVIMASLNALMMLKSHRYYSMMHGYDIQSKKDVVLDNPSL